MKRAIVILLSVCAVLTVAYFSASRCAIHHNTLTFSHILRGDRTVSVDIAVRRDREMEAMADMIELPLVILSHGNTVKPTEYSFLANVFAARGYLVVRSSTISPSDPPLITKVGQAYVGRRDVYIRCVFNILFAFGELKRRLGERRLRPHHARRPFQWRRHFDVCSPFSYLGVGLESHHARQSACAFCA